MNSIRSIHLVLALAMFAQLSAGQQTIAESQAARDARMKWWRESRFGMFIHWGVYSIPARGEWVMYNEKIPVAEYETFPPRFNPVKFDAAAWVQTAKAAGARYIVITSKHHDGFCMWDSKVTTYDIMDATPFKRDPLAELAGACRAEGIRLCFYYSIMDWHHPLAHGKTFAEYRDTYMIPELKELITQYHPAVLWFDGQWIAEWDEDQGRRLYDELRALDPALIMNNRIGKGRNDLLGANTGAALVGDFGTPEQYIPEDELKGLDWESCMTMNDNWGYAAKDSNWKSVSMLVRNLIDVASKGGNYLLNVGPTSMGEIPAQSVMRLRAIGTWLRVNGDAIYGSAGSPFETTPWGRCTMKSLGGKGTRLFLEVFNWPHNRVLAVPGLATDPGKAMLLGDPSASLAILHAGDTLELSLPSTPPDTICPVVVLDFPGDVLTFHRPKVTAPAPIFADRTAVTLSVPSQALEIRYTLDGSDPTPVSSRYAAPVQLTETARLRAQTFYRGRPVSEIVEREFTKTHLRKPAEAVPRSPGLRFEYFEGDWSRLPDFDTLKVIEAGISGEIGIGMRHRNDKFGLRFTGFLDVPEDGVYLMALNSDDGSRITIDGTMIIDNDGLHSDATKQNYVALAKGEHAVTIDYFNNLWEGALGLRIGPAGEPLQPVTAGQLSHTP